MKIKQAPPRPAASGREMKLLRQVNTLKRELAEASRLASFPGDNPMPVCELGANGRISYSNAALQHLFPELNQRSTAHPWIKGITRDVLPQFKAGQTLVHREIAIGDRWYDQAIYHVKTEQLVRIYGRDITARKQAERSLMAANEELTKANRELSASEQQHKATNEELTAMNQELRASEEEIRSANDELMASQEELKESNLELTVADENLKEANARARDILKSMTDAYFVCDEQWHLTSVNPHAARNLFQRPAAELLGTEIWSVPPVRDDDALAGRMRQCATDRCYGRFEWHDRATDLWYEVHVNPRPGRVDVNLRDITERKQHEQELQNSQRLLTELFNAVTETIWLMDLDGNILAANDTAVQRLGMTAGSVIGRNCYDLIPARLKEPRQARIREMVRTGQPVRFEDERNGIIFDHNFYPVRDTAGTITGLVIFSRDITERKRGEQERERLLAELKHHAAELDTVYNVLPYLVSVHGPDGQYQRVNAAMVNLFGFDPTTATRQEIARQVKAHFPAGTPLTPDNMPSSRALRGEEVRDVEYVISDGQGREHTLLMNALPLMVDGQVKGAILAQADITERKLAEQALHRAQSRTATILDGIADTFYSLDRQWRFTIVNPAAERSPFGKPAAELLGKCIWDMYPNLVGTPIQRHYFDAAEQRSLEHYEARSPLNGRWYEVFMQGWEDGVDVYMRDITDRRGAEQAIQQEKDRLASLISSITDEVWFADVNGTFTLANPSAVQEFSLSSKDGTKVQDLAESLEVLRSDGSPRPVDEAPPLRALRGAVVQNEEEIVRTPSSGELRYRQVSSAPVRDANGGIIGSVSVVRDITDRKQKEEELKQLNRTLTALGRSSQAMMRAQSEQSYLDEVCGIVIEDCGHAMVWIGYAEQDQAKTVRPVSHCGFEDGYLDTLHITWDGSERGRGPTGTAIRTGEPSLCRNMLTDPAFEPWRAEAVKRGYASSVVLPLLSGDKAFGAVSIYSRDPDPFTESEVALLSKLAGDLAHGIGVIRQRGARELAEQALAESEERYRKLVTYAPAAIYEMNLQGTKFLSVNQAMCDILMYAQDELMATAPADLLDPESTAMFRERVRQKLAGEDVTEMVEYRIRRKDGAWIDAAINVSAIKMAGDVSDRVMVIAYDITEQKKYQRALRESEERFRAIATASPVGIGVVSSPDAKYQYTNAAYEQAFGYGPGELLGKTTPQIYADIADRDRLLQELKQKGRVANFEIRLKRKDGTVFWSLSSVQPITYGGQPAMLGAFVDITERKRMEQEITSLAKFPGENPNPVLRLKGNGELLYANEKSSPLLRSWHAAVGGKIPGNLSEIAAAARKEGSVKIVEIEGNNRIYSLEFIPVSGAEYLNLYGRDITDRKLAENALERERANLRTIFDSVNTGLLLVDAQGVVARANSTAAGWASKDISSSGRAQPGDLLGCAHALDAPGGCGTSGACGACPIRNAFKTALRTGRTVKGAEAEVQFGAGGAKGRAWFEVDANPVTIEGRPHVIITLNNITERKQAEQIVSQQQRELQAANQELSAKNQELLASEEELRATTEAVMASEAALRESETKLRAIFETSADAIGVSHDGKLVVVNPAYRSLFGYAVDDVLAGTPITDLIVPPQRATVSENVRKRSQPGEPPASYETRGLRKDGTEFDLDARVSTYELDGITFTMVILRDITERKLAELALRESEGKYRALFDNMIDGVALHRIMYDATGKARDYVIEDVNRAFETITGLSASKAMGQKASELYGTGASPYLDIYARVAAGGHPERFDTVFDPMQKSFSIAVFSPAAGYFTTVFEDITERKKFDEALKESENRFRAIFEQAAVGVALLNTETGQFVRINHQYCSFLGYTMEEMLQKTFQDVTFETDVQTNTDYNAQLRNGKLNSATFEKRYVRKDGAVVWGSLTISPLWKQGDTPRTYLHIAIVQDITQRKRFEEELRQSREELEQRVKERTAELLKAHHQLETTRRLSDIGTLASTVAHELRNPLAAIRMATYNIKRKAQMPELEKHLANIDAKVSDSDQIITNLLFYSRIRTVEYASVDISALLDESLETVAGRHQNKQVSYVKEYAGLAGGTIDGDRLLLKEVFDNLIDNALDAVPDQGGRIVLSADTHDPGLYVIRMKDNGTGIDPAMLQKVFDPFFSTKSKGTGLGLAVCRQIIELHQGQIAIESVPGQGTTVTVSLPRKKDNA